MNTRLCLIGYGKMGQMIEGLAASYGCEVVSRIDPHHCDCSKEISPESLKDAEVCIDFSHPSVVLKNIKQLTHLAKPLVVGTTGWNAHLEEVKDWVKQFDTALLYGANFSIGMNLFTRLVADAARLFDRFDHYDIYGLELHHNQKADSPSGTAIELSKLLLQNISRKSNALYDPAYRRIEPHELHFASIRAGSIPGTHTIGFDSEADTIELTHRARSRSGFAAGALQAARWIKDRKGCYSINDMISELIC